MNGEAGKANGPPQPCDVHVAVLKTHLAGEFKLVEHRLDAMHDTLQVLNRSIQGDGDPRQPSLMTRVTVLEGWTRAQRKWNLIIGTAVAGWVVQSLLAFVKP
jgi:hypothetical protein